MSEVYYLVSTAGFPNFGDEQIVRTWLTIFRQKNPSAKIILDVPAASRSQFLFKGEFDNLTIVDTLWKVIHFLAHKQIKLDDVQGVKDVLLHGDPRNREGLDLFLSADQIQLLGGGYFTTSNVDFVNTYYFFPIFAAKKELATDTKVYGTGLGLTPIAEETQKMLESTTGVFDYLGVRDVESSKVANTTLELDDVYVSKMLEALKLDTREDNPDILIDLQDISDNTHRQQIVKEITDFLNAEENVGKTVGILEALVPEDNWPYFSDAFNDVINKDERFSFFNFFHLWHQGLPNKEKQTWISTRFHFHLIGGILLNHPGVAINIGNDYYATKHLSLIKNSGLQFLDYESEEPVNPTTAGMVRKTIVAKKTKDKLKKMVEIVQG